MTRYYLDTSALVKRYRTERGMEAMAALFSERTWNDEFITSHLTVLEVQAVAARALGARLLTQRAYESLLRLFNDDLEQAITVLPLTSAVLSEAIGVARQYTLRAGDCIHLATALRTAQAEAVSATIVFVTSDMELYRAAGRAGFTPFNPENEQALDRLGNWRQTQQD